MALQSQSTSPIADFAALVRRQLWSILLPFAFITALGVMVAQLMPKTYEVTTLVKVPESGIPGGGNAIQRDINSATKDIKAEPLVRSVIESQEWSDFIELTDKEKIDYVKRVVKNITATVGAANKNSPGSSYLDIRYRDAEPTRAESFLNALRDRYIDYVVQSVRKEAKETRDALKELREKCLAEWKDAEKAKSDLVKTKNLSQTLPGGQGRGEDPVYSRWVAAQGQQSEAVAELELQKSKLEYVQHLFEVEPDTIPESQAAALANAAPKPDPEDDVARQVRELEIAILELREKQKDYRPAASKYKQIEDEIARSEAKIAILRGETTELGAKTGPSRFVANPQRAVYEQSIRDIKGTIQGLQVKINGLKAEILTLGKEHADRTDSYLQLQYLLGDVERAQASYAGADGAWAGQVMRVAMLEGPQANPFELVQVALASDTALSPNVPVFIVVSVLLGLAAGLGWALTSEFLRNGYRGISDLTRGMAVPVLGAVNLITTRAQSRRTLTRHMMIGASSLVIVCSILWITWAYQHDPLRLLGPQLMQLIDNVRLNFRP